MHTLTAATSLLTHSLAWALLHSLWQGLVIYGALYLLLKALPNINAQAKYYLSMSAFSALFLWFADTWVTQYEKLKGVTVYITRSATDGGVSITYPVKTLLNGNLHNPLPGHFLPRLEAYFPLLMALYSLGLTFMLCRFVVNIIQVKTLRKQGIIMPEEQWSNLVSQLQKQFDITRPVQLFLSKRINVPMMLGTLKPIILLPVATLSHLTTEQVEAILLHELAHIKRHDYLLNIFQTIAETILFFNPFVWLLSGIIRREREHCCDDLVVACSASPLPYAHALAILEDHRRNNSLTLAVTGSKKYLFHRIKRIMEMKKKNVNYSQLTIILLATVAITVSIALFTFTPSFAQKAKKNDANDTTQKRVYKYKSVTIDSNGKKKVVDKVSTKPIKEKYNDDDDNNLDVKITINDDKHDSSGAKVYTKVVVGPSGRQKVIRTHINANGKEEEIKDENSEQMSIDMEQMADDLKDMVQNLVSANVDIDGVNWDEIKDDLRKKLSELDKTFNDPKVRKELTREMRKEMEASKAAIMEAQEEIEKAGNIHVKVMANAKDREEYKKALADGEVARKKGAQAREQSENDRIQSQKDIEQSKRDVEQSKRDVEQSRKDIEQSKRDVEQSKKDVEQSKRDVEQSRKELQTAKKMTDNFEPMLIQMEQDGLINRSRNYSIAKDNDALYINGEKQPENVYRKYERYLKDKNVAIKEQEGKRTITVED